MKSIEYFILEKQEDGYKFNLLNIWNKSIEELVDTLNLTYNTFKEKDVEVISIIANKVLAEDKDLINIKLKTILIIFFIRSHPRFALKKL